jgi:hypothetical protein
MMRNKITVLLLKKHEENNLPYQKSLILAFTLPSHTVSKVFLLEIMIH